jgi:hypothetical protein
MVVADWQAIWDAAEESLARLFARDGERRVDELAARRQRVAAVESEDEDKPEDES